MVDVLFPAFLGQAPNVTFLSISCLDEDCLNIGSENYLSLLKLIFRSHFVSPEHLAESKVVGGK